MFIQFITDQNITGEGFEAYFWTDKTIGMNDIPSDAILKIYPNPFSDRVQISLPNPANEEYKLIITDLSGKVLKIIDNITGSVIDMNRNGLSKGLYLLELRGPNTYRGKIVIE